MGVRRLLSAPRMNLTPSPAPFYLPSPPAAARHKSVSAGSLLTLRCRALQGVRSTAACDRHGVRSTTGLRVDEQPHRPAPDLHTVVEQRGLLLGTTRGAVATGGRRRPRHERRRHDCPRDLADGAHDAQPARRVSSWVVGIAAAAAAHCAGTAGRLTELCRRLLARGLRARPGGVMTAERACACTRVVGVGHRGRPQGQARWVKPQQPKKAASR